MTFIAALMVMIVLGSIITLLLYVTQGQRRRLMNRLSRQHDYDYQHLAALDQDTRSAGFMLFTAGQSRHVRHQVSGTLTCPDNRQSHFKSFDYSVVTPSGMCTQSVLIIETGRHASGAFYISPHNGLQTDLFVDHPPNQQPSLNPLPAGVTPEALIHHQILAEYPAQLTPLLQAGLLDWLMAHPDVTIEYASSLLMVYRPEFLLDPEHIPTALMELATLNTSFDRQTSQR